MIARVSMACLLAAALAGGCSSSHTHRLEEKPITNRVYGWKMVQGKKEWGVVSVRKTAVYRCADCAKLFTKPPAKSS